ncbi:uncharacterized protein LOC122068492 [Macadamia integrifolia]|uniref:uncharacterized protein LOC122068492 n=1 Tax=Macadamia integrifolia TaxID=60698 RepID=UPI001C501F13|nr:uncharacterized protein LOC122068492 [Macadamia integrifolia]
MANVDNTPIISSTDDDVEELILATLLIVQYHYSSDLYTREPRRDSAFTGATWVHEVLHGHANRCYEEFGMERHVFLNLCLLMRHRGWLQDSRKIRVDEQLAMFMFRITGVGPTNRAVEERFQHSGQTVNYYFGKVLQGVLKLSKEYIKAPSFDEIPMEIIANNKWWPYFKDCIGAIDGTHVTAIVPKGKQIPYRGRKGITTHNGSITL